MPFQTPLKEFSDTTHTYNIYIQYPIFMHKNKDHCISLKRSNVRDTPIDKSWILTEDDTD